ncbi:MAG: type II toxin-antitoxin system Phd/YefM family antitoxin [Nitrospirae bacterium]|nr:type II toxin-antitoxin system Phd/YefM family antitoxin [Magnetococcales bacterium]
MIRLAAKEAKNHFGQWMDQAQREPMTIEKNGPPAVVVISMEGYRQGEQWKLEKLQSDLDAGIAQANRKELLDGDQVFNEL